MKNISMLLSAFIAVLLVMTLQGCSFSPDSADQVTNKPEITEASSAEAASADEVIDDVMIDTAYGDIGVPEIYEASLKYKSESSEDCDRYAFYAKPDDQHEIKVYTVCFDLNEPEDKTYYIGTVPDKEGKTRFVYALLENEIDTEEYTSEQEDLIYSIQETVNNVEGYIKRFSGFEE